MSLASLFTPPPYSRRASCRAWPYSTPTRCEGVMHCFDHACRTCRCGKQTVADPAPKDGRGQHRRRKPKQALDTFNAMTAPS